MRSPRNFRHNRTVKADVAVKIRQGRNKLLVLAGRWAGRWSILDRANLGVISFFENCLALSEHEC